MLVVVLRTVVVILLAALCWAVIIAAFMTWGFWGGIAVSGGWLGAGLTALFWRGRR
jgi:hypothetical protein